MRLYGPSEIMRFAFKTGLVSQFDSNSEPPEPVVYEYPQFNINEKGELTATYLTDNRNLRFKIDSKGQLVGMFTGQSPGLKIVGNELVREVT